MLGLILREEFRGKRLKGTAIERSNDSNTDANQIAAKAFLEITYPTLTHGGLSLREILSPMVELSRTGA